MEGECTCHGKEIEFVPVPNGMPTELQHFTFRYWLNWIK